ncbi:MAG TPA: hypothetical protein VJ654_15895 [Noviherbaspirillum sp.]|nr:hypothetical protein [Noviherbaspirillum sp.]
MIQSGVPISSVITHRGTKIVTLEHGEAVAEHCRAGDIALVQDKEGWWTQFVGENGQIEGYDTPFESYNKALWTAKAAAEFSADE